MEKIRFTGPTNNKRKENNIIKLSAFAQTIKQIQFKRKTKAYLIETEIKTYPKLNS